jgi:serine/threonine protein kinase
MQKNPNDRISINEILEHPWIQKYHKTKLPELRKKNKDKIGSIFKMYSTCDENNLSHRANNP